MSALAETRAAATSAPHALTAGQVADAFGSDAAAGLANADAAERLGSHGPNELPEPSPEPFVRRLGRHAREPMSLLLVAAAGVAGIALREVIDAVAILAIVVLNTVIALVEEGRAEHALAALRRLQEPAARVIREGRLRVVPARDVVPGELITVAAGDRVPADARLVGGDDLEVDESMLTGESLPAAKDAAAVCAEASLLAERTNLLYSGTLVTRGQGRGIAVATGSRTVLGRIASAVQQPRSATPLQRELARTTGRLGVTAVAIAAAVFALTLLRLPQGAPLEVAFLSAVTLAVAAVPEGLATVTVVALALGVRRMAAQGAIVRRLPAVETLGSTTVLVIDKTGTLTENHMRVAAGVAAGGAAVPVDALPEVVRSRLERIAALCNDATLDPPSGDPTEIALLEFVGPERVRQLVASSPRVATTPFDSRRRRMSTLHRLDDRLELQVKGAPEELVGRSANALCVDGTVRGLDARTRQATLEAAERAAAAGARVLALGWRDVAGAPGREVDAEVGLTLAGLLVLADPVRPDAARTVAEASQAGISLVMATGDHPGTAAAIAAEAGLAAPGARVLTGVDLHRDGLPADPATVPLYARVDPEDKLDLVAALQARGQVVAMTGDGVNDAPALRHADIGVALGAGGSDVARAAADMIVTDDNLATIVAAVREGRGIYANIRKVVDYLVAGNLSEITVVVVALILFPQIGVPLLPLQLLWVNLLTDGLPALALAVDPIDRSVMLVPPRPVTQRLLDGARMAVLAGRGAVIAAGPLAALVITRFGLGESWDHARGVLFTTLIVAHLALVAVARRGTGLTRGRPQPNRWLAAAIMAELALQAVIVTWPPAQALFGTATLTVREWLLVAAAGAVPAGLLLAVMSWRRRPT